MMRSTELESQLAPSAAVQPRWNEVLRALRETRGVTQEGWAAHIGVSYKTIQRWEAGDRAPDAGAEAAIVAYCRERSLFRTFQRGPLAGLELTPDLLHDLLAEARWRGERGRRGTREPRTQDAKRSTEGSEAGTPEAAPHRPPSNLPVVLTSFVGRERELAAVRRVLGGTRLVTLTGAGGCGKTRLTLALAEELLWAYPHGVCFVELAALTDPALVPETVAAALGLWTAGPQPVMKLLVEHLGSRHMLLILDNCEHLLPACAVLAETLLRACPHLEVLTTSREPLGIGGETIWRVPPMTVPSETGANSELEEADAVRLFVERVRLYRPEFALTVTNAAAVVEVCTRLDGMPLALELAAACVKALSVEQIAARLSDRFRLLTGGSRTALPRQQTLRATLDWSDELLSPAERAIFRRLSVFAGGFALEAAEAVCGDRAEDVLDVLSDLVDKSLVLAEEQGGVVRYRLLETVRQYAAEKLDAVEETGAARDRHLTWCLALVEAAGAELRRPHEPVWLTRLEEEHDNLRGALAWALAQGEAETALRLAGALPRFWEVHGHMSEGRQWLLRALEAGKDASLLARATALHGAGTLAYMQGDYTAARVFHEQSLALSHGLGDRHGIAMAQDHLGYVALRFGDHATAQALLEASLAAHTESGYKPGMGRAQTGLGFLALRQGDYAAALAHCEAALAIWRELGNSDGIAGILEDLATMAAEQGDTERQMALLEESLALYREIGNRGGVAMVLGHLGMATWRQDSGRGAALLEESLALYRELGDRRGIARLLGNQAFVALSQRDHDQAEALCRESLGLYRELSDVWGIARYLPVLAGTAFGQGQIERAARLFGAAAALRERLGAPLPPVVQPAHDRAVAAVRAALGADAFKQAWTAGWSPSWEAAVAHALGDAKAA